MPPELKRDHYYTYEDFLEIDTENRYELNDGILYMMSSPSDNHQAISTMLIIRIGNFLEGKACELRHDLNVHLWKDRDTVYIPDIFVVCDRSKLSRNGCIGAPDFIIEIVSPSNAYRDYLVKLKDYEQAGVKEYWIIDPEGKKILVNILADNRYRLRIYTFDDLINVSVLPGCQLSLSMFQEATDSF